MKSKKGSLELSINAIVILVLAITLLGLGLTFIRGLFSKATDKLGGFVDAADLENPPTAENPLGISDSIEITLDSEKEFKIGLYNNNAWGTGTANNVAFAFSKCVISGQTVKKTYTENPLTYTNLDIMVPFIKMVPQTISASKLKGFKTIISLKKEDLKKIVFTDVSGSTAAKYTFSSPTFAATEKNPYVLGTYVCNLVAAKKNSDTEYVAQTTTLNYFSSKQIFVKVTS